MQPDLQQLQAACLRGDAAAVQRLLGGRGAAGQGDGGRAPEISSPHSAQLKQLKVACLRGDAAAVQRVLDGRGTCCLGDGSAQADEALAAALRAPLPSDGGRTLLHYLCTGESLGIGGCLLLALAGAPARPAAGGGAAVWPARHQRGRAQVLALLLARQPRLALLAGSRDAARNTPLHCCMLSRSWQVLAVLLAALQQLLACDAAGSQPGQQPQQQQGAATALQLLLSVPDAGGLSALELAIKLRQWPAARLLAAATGGGLPLSKPQMEACSLVRQYLRLSRTGSSSSSLASGSGGLAGGVEQPGIHVSASRATVTEALGGLLSKLWDAFGATPAGEAAADELAAAARLAGAPQSDSGGSSSGDASQPGSSREAAVPLRLQPQAVSQADVLALVREQERRAAAEAASAGAAASSGASAAAAPGSSSEALPCIVCFEDMPPDAPVVRLPCGHRTCDACWRGILQASIDEGDPRRAVCPEPGCGMPLPSATAAHLLPVAALGRFQQLLAQRYVTTHPRSMRSCPQASCGALLHLPGTAAAGRGEAAGEAGKPAEEPAVGAAPWASVVEAAAAGAGLDAECCACGHLLCWRCGEEAHEPASCGQMRRWGEELAALRRAAPDADQQWLSSNTKRCPKCLARIQARGWAGTGKQGGCNHMTCKGCGHHFCWVCGRAWEQHSPETGGFFYCNLEQHHELPEYSMASSGASEGGSLGGPLAWLAGVWGSIKAAAQQQQLQRHLRQYLRLSGGRAALGAAAAQMERLLAAVGMLGGPGGGGSSGGGGSGMGPELLGVSQAEAARMGGLEWAELVAAAAASAADAAAELPPLAVPAATSAADAALAAAAASSGCSGEAAAGGVAYLQQLAEGVAAARGLLQHSAVALYELPSGTHRRHLQQMSAAIQARLEQLEPLLLALPEREALPPQPLVPSRPGQQSQPAQRCGGGGGSGGGRRGGLTGWLLHKLYGLDASSASAGSPADRSAPEHHPAVAGLGPEVLLQQAQFAAAVHQHCGAIQAALGALRADMRQMHVAARAGLFAS